MARYTLLITLVLIADGIGVLEIKTVPLAAFIGTVSASMALFGWVLQGLFRGNQK